MERDKIYKKWIDNRCFIIENDRLKETLSVFSSFPRCDNYGFKNAKLREIILSDLYARYYRLTDKNVMFPMGFQTLCYSSFVENKKQTNKLDNTIQEEFLSELKDFGISIDINKLIDFRSDSYVSSLQQFFIDLYKRGYIEYTLLDVYKDNNRDKIYDSITKPNHKLDLVKHKCFALKIDNLDREIYHDINNLKISDDIKNQMINYLEPSKYLSITFNLSNGLELEYNLENPEFLGGVSYIFLNPKFIDYERYVDSEELESIRNLINTDDLFAYTGLYAINPLTNKEIPIFLTYMYNLPIYLGVPGIDKEEELVAQNYELEIINILDEFGSLINSGILDGLSLSYARDNAKNILVNNNIGELRTKYNKKYILLSSLDNFGALFPFLYDTDTNEINSLEGYLPYNFSKEFRPILNSDVDVSGETIDGSMNNLFIEGALPFISLIYDKFMNVESLFTEEYKNELFKWFPIKKYSIDKESIASKLFMPIVFYNIFKKELGYDLNNLFDDVFVFGNILDIKYSEIKKENNNLIDIDELLNKYYPDSIRVFMLSQDISNDFLFNHYELNDIDNFIKRIEEALLKNISNNTTNYDYYFLKFKNDCKYYIENNKIIDYIKLIFKFSKEYIIEGMPSKNNILTYLIAISPIMPYLSEYIYSNLFDDKYSLINEGWN